MFFDVFSQLCKDKGVSNSKAALDMGINKSTVTYWKSSAVVPNGTTLNKIADYFGVSVDYLLGNEQKEKPTVNKDDEHDILDDIDLAFYGGFKELTEENKAVLRDMVRIMRERQDK